jgi:uncharacterized LabA/DUF88 family protein
MNITNNNQKRIGVFIDGSNIWHCQKENGWRIDYYKLKKYLAQRGKIVGLYYFTPKIKGYEKFKTTLDSMGYTVVYKPLKKIKTSRKGQKFTFKYKGNLDIEMAQYILTLSDKYDEIVFMSGDSDFECILETLKRQGKKISCICNKTSLSIEISNVCHTFINLTDLRKVLRYKQKQPRQNRD